MCKDCERGTFKEKVAPNIDDWEDPIYRHPKRRKPIKEKWGPRRTSISNHCEANDNDSHMPVIVEVHYWFLDKPQVRYERMCIGCGRTLKTYREHGWRPRRSPVGYDFAKEDIYQIIYKPRYNWMKEF